MSIHSWGAASLAGPLRRANDLAVPGQRYTFGVVKAAQARGDFDVLVDRGLRVHLGPDVAAGHQTLRYAVQEALA